MSLVTAVDRYLAACDSEEPLAVCGWIPPSGRSRAVHAAVDAALEALPRLDGAQVAREEGLADDPELDAKLDHGIFLHEYERAVFGRTLPSWLQTIGDCGSMGTGRAVQDNLITDRFFSGGLVATETHEVATEPLYAGSRVEVGGGRLSGDGTMGSWVCKFLMDYGVLLRQRYGDVDLTTYDGRRARAWGRRGAGCPDSLEPHARRNPVAEATQVRSGEAAIPFLANLIPIAMGSDQGYAKRRGPNGVCRRSGRWMHLMEDRGIARGRDGNLYVPKQNSWGDYLGDLNNVFETASGRRVELPPGCFMVRLEDAHDAYRQGDAFAIAPLRGWKPSVEGSRLLLPASAL